MSGLKGKLLSAPVIISGLYFLAIMPRMRGKPDMTPLDAKLFAHRGLFDNRTGGLRLYCYNHIIRRIDF